MEGIQGIVTYAFTLNGAYYYTIQTPDDLADDDPNTSEAIILYAGTRSWPIQVGDLVSVTGKVDEYAYDGYSDANQTDLKTTQIKVNIHLTISSVITVSTDHSWSTKNQSI